MRHSQGGPGSVRFGYGLGMERFERFRFSVPAVPLRRGFLCVSVQFHREDGSGSGFGSWKTVLAVPVPRSVPAKTVPTVPVSGSGSVPAPPCIAHSVTLLCPVADTSCVEEARQAEGSSSFNLRFPSRRIPNPFVLYSLERWNGPHRAASWWETCEERWVALLEASVGALLSKR